MASIVHPRHLSVAAMLVLIAACSDATMAPRRSLPIGAPSPDALGLGPRDDAVAGSPSSSDASKGAFVLTARGGTFRVGQTSVTFPASAVCDPRTSTYGPTEWEKPCDVLREPITIHALVHHVFGAKKETWVEFTPQLRFVPAATADRWVWMATRVPSSWPLGILSIRWAPTFGGAPIDESLSNPTLRTWVLPHHTAVRRLEHFSFYVISTG
ncbi:MAG: hypothetical protein NVS4B3_07940 [Gemmatimonadaceae bacterium]